MRPFWWKLPSRPEPELFLKQVYRPNQDAFIYLFVQRDSLRRSKDKPSITVQEISSKDQQAGFWVFPRYLSALKIDLPKRKEAINLLTIL